MRPDCRHGLSFTLAEEVVTADQRAHHAARLAQRLLQRAAGARGGFFQGHANVGGLLSANAAKELIHVMHHAQLAAHAVSSRSLSAMPDARRRRILDEWPWQVKAGDRPLPSSFRYPYRKQNPRGLSASRLQERGRGGRHDQGQDCLTRLAPVANMSRSAARKPVRWYGEEEAR